MSALIYKFKIELFSGQENYDATERQRFFFLKLRDWEINCGIHKREVLDASTWVFTPESKKKLGIVNNQPASDL